MGSLWKIAIEANVTPFPLLRGLKLRRVSTNAVGVQIALRALVLSGMCLGCTGAWRMEELGAGGSKTLGMMLDFSG
jgi:hypothetical protein